MNIDYIIIASDDSHYLDFYEPISEAWKKLGFNTFMLHITDKDSEIKIVKNGIYKSIKKHPKYPSGWQAQLVRLYAYNFLEEKNLLLSDIDMMPLSKNFFLNNSISFKNDCILNYSGQPYSDVPYYPICYILGNTEIMKQTLSLPETFYNFLEQVEKSHTIKWNTDEHYLYDKINKYEKLISLPIRDYKANRIDRSNWTYDKVRVKNNEYIDSHLIRPYKEYKNEINKLLNLIGG